MVIIFVRNRIFLNVRIPMENVNFGKMYINEIMHYEIVVILCEALFLRVTLRMLTTEVIHSLEFFIILIEKLTL